MKEQFVTYEIALKLKELVFDEECSAIYNGKNLKIKHQSSISDMFDDDYDWDSDIIQAPLYQQAFDFFREKHNIHISVDYCKYSIEKLNGWYYTFDFQTDAMPNRLGKYDTYEQAREQSILKAIELCQKK